ncbi:hypothetical protein ACEPAG_3870 [Sanghuangporus baumii]
MSPSFSFKAIIFDIGDVLFSWSPATKTSIRPSVLKSLVNSPIWHEFERGRISQDECYSRLASTYSLDKEQIGSSFEEARKTLRFDNRLFDFIADIKSKYGVAIFAMSNVSAPDYAYLRAKNADWNVFDGIFPSCTVGQRKPDLSFYRYVLSRTNVPAENTVFVDDKFDNVLSARSLGMHGVVFRNPDELMQAIRNLVCDPIERAKDFLTSHARQHNSFTETGVVIYEWFSQLIIYELTHDESIVELPTPTKIVNFFRGKGQLTSENYPCDLDSTSLAWTTLPNIDKKAVESVMDEMLKYRNSDGIIEVYFDPSRPRLDPVVCVNTLSLFYKYERGSDIPETLEWSVEVLKNRAYLDGSRYYASAECFLYFFSRLLHQNKELFEKYAPLLKERLQERVGLEGDSLALAMRIYGCNLVGIRNDIDLQRLRSRQAPDGSWADGWVYRYGVHGTHIANKGLTTALAIDAIQNFNLSES